MTIDLQARRDHRILICTPSNRAADQIATALLSTGIDGKKLFRMYSLTKRVDEQPLELRDVSCIVYVLTVLLISQDE